MTGNTHHIVKQIFKTDTLENVSVKELEKISRHYPFFSVAHYLFSKKLFLRKEKNFHAETKKTALYFTNPFWLQWLLENSDDEKSVETKTSASEIKKTVPLYQPSVEGGPIRDISFEKTPLEKQPAGEPDDPIFEPYHTIDYFASQGIKFIAEENPSDKLGKQLKSFTEWLKTMKKLPEKVEEENIASTEQATIDGFAEHSIEQKEILTEAMAQVLARQGKYEDAVELYRKLSLINPSKSVYFAAKIEQLNPL